MTSESKGNGKSKEIVRITVEYVALNEELRLRGVGAVAPKVYHVTEYLEAGNGRKTAGITVDLRDDVVGITTGTLNMGWTPNSELDTVHRNAAASRRAKKTATKTTAPVEDLLRKPLKPAMVAIAQKTPRKPKAPKSEASEA